MRFKKETIGNVRHKVTKTLEQMAQILRKLGIVSSIEEGRTLTPELVGADLPYAAFKSLRISYAEDYTKKEKRYLISKILPVD